MMQFSFSFGFDSNALIKGGGGQAVPSNAWLKNDGTPWTKPDGSLWLRAA